MWNWYYKLLARRPHLVLISTAVISTACIAISLTFNKFPEFSDPSLVSVLWSIVTLKRIGIEMFFV